MGIILRPYQKEIVDSVRDHFNKGTKSALIQLSTGGGKTVIGSFMMEACKNKDMTAYFMCHRRELIKQTLATLKKFGLEAGVVSAQFEPDPSKRIQVCSVPTAVRRLNKLPQPNLIFWDEARFIGSATWTKTYEHFKDSYHVLLDATPVRLDGKALGKYADVMVQGPSMRTLINEGHLSDYSIFVPSTPDLTGVKKSMGDYQRGQLSQAMSKPQITGCAIREYKKVASGKRAVVFCVSIDHSKQVVRDFNASGVRAVHIDGNTPTVERDKAIEDFAAGRVHILSNVDIASCGLDIPAMEALILLRPTQSLSLYLQQVGRVLRPVPGKKAIILDHAGNALKHGLPCEERAWSLTSSENRSQGKAENTSIKICDACFAANPNYKTECTECGAKFVVQGRKIEEVDGELTELKVGRKPVSPARAAQSKAQTLEQLIQLGRDRGYKRPAIWAKHIFNARQAKRLKGRK